MKLSCNSCAYSGVASDSVSECDKLLERAKDALR